MGVNTPMAAAVAAATCGLAIERHKPNGGIFTIGILSITLAAGMPSAMVRFLGSTVNLLGATPCEHSRLAPIVTCVGITYSGVQ
jgi:hypothetical protein